MPIHFRGLLFWILLLCEYLYGVPKKLYPRGPFWFFAPLIKTVFPNSNIFLIILIVLRFWLYVEWFCRITQRTTMIWVWSGSLDKKQDRGVNWKIKTMTTCSERHLFNAHKCEVRSYGFWSWRLRSLLCTAYFFLKL